MTSTKIFPTDVPSKANPTTSDILLIADQADNSELKKITIGDITTDIGAGLIVDGSASSTTTYSSDKINTLNGTQDTALTNGLALKVNKAGDTMTGRLEQAKGADIASATATPLGTATGNYVDITGTTTITSFTTATAGTQIKVRFTDALILTHNATSLILPTGANITTIANDTAEFVSLGSGNWKCLWYTRASGAGLVPFDTSTLVTSLTEDTAGDMDADFVFAYDNSVSANRKQKVNVFRATDAEAETGTSTTKFITPAQVNNFGVGTDIKNTWTNLVISPITWGYLNTPYLWGSVGYTANSTGAGVNTISSGLPGGSLANMLYRYDDGKDFRIKFRFGVDLRDDTTLYYGIGLSIVNSTIYTANTDTTNGTIRFVFKNTPTGVNTIFAHNSNGTATSTDITSGVDFTKINTYEIVFTHGTDIKFYINGTLKATHTTNLPTTGTPLLAVGVGQYASNHNAFLSNISISIEN